MKAREIFLKPFVVAFFLCSTLFAQQSSSGIYLSGDDFRQEKISYSSQSENKYQIKLNTVFYKPYVTIISGKTEIHLSKDSIFGYRDNSNISYRFYDKHVFTVINVGENILLYKLESVSNAKGFVTVTNYFFSGDASSPVLPLTRINLKKSFSENSTFTELIDIYFKSDDELLWYDKSNKMYKVNRVFQLSETISSQPKTKN